jgi:hypothetical protein
MSDNNQQDDLFGEPPLIKGENSARYYRLFAAIKHEIKPETVFDKIRVRELADKLWQQQRCKRSAASLVEGAYIEALASLLRPFSPPTIPFGEDVAAGMARDDYSGEAKPSKAQQSPAKWSGGIASDAIRDHCGTNPRQGDAPL